MSSVEIKDYDPAYQAGIDVMMREIQKEFKEAITGPQSTIIKQVYRLSGQKYWVALCGDKVAGTIGVVLSTSGYAEIKRMMVHPEFRGTEIGTAGKLLQTALDWIKTQGIKRIYLGTMEQFKVAQRFYEKNGFVKIAEKELPKDYKVNPIDTLFYSRNLI